MHSNYDRKKKKSFEKSGFNFAILQASGNVPEEIDKLHNWVIGVVNNFTPSFRNIPERSSISEGLVSSKFFKYFEYFV